MAAQRLFLPVVAAAGALVVATGRVLEGVHYVCDVAARGESQRVSGARGPVACDFNGWRGSARHTGCMMLLRDIPEGTRIVSPGTPDAVVEGVAWFDDEGEEVRVFFGDGTVRNGSGRQEIALDGGVATVVSTLRWGPPRWDERTDDAWDAYIAGDETAVFDILAGVDEIEFSGDYDVWTFVESGLILEALILDRRGQHAESAALRARLDVEERSKHPQIARDVLVRIFGEELPDDPRARLKESARRWARAGAVGRDGAGFLSIHEETLGDIRRAGTPVNAR